MITFADVICFFIMVALLVGAAVAWFLVARTRHNIDGFGDVHKAGLDGPRKSGSVVFVAAAPAKSAASRHATRKPFGGSAATPPTGTDPTESDQ